MMFIWLLLKVRLLLSFSWINQQRLILLIIIRFLILSAPGLVSAGLFSIGSSLISQTVFSALILGQFYLMPKSYCMVCLKALSWGQSKFLLYTTPLSKVIQNHPVISFQFYADDTQLYVHLTYKNVASALDKLSCCLEDVKTWLSTNKLKLNPDKTKFIVFGSKSQHEKLNHSFLVNILSNRISPVDAVRKPWCLV